MPFFSRSLALLAASLLSAPALMFAQESSQEPIQESAPTSAPASTPGSSAEAATPTPETPPSSEKMLEITARRDAKAAMENWLNLIEQGQFVESWREASPQFRQTIGAGRWATTCRNLRRPTGKLLGRDLSEEHYHTEYYQPNGHLAKGEMVTFIFISHFEHLKAATEIVILQPFDNRWQVVSYSLKPKF